MPWVTRGLRDGVVTTRYPARPDDYGAGWYGSVSVTDGAGGAERPGLVALCPTGAISNGSGRLRVDQGRCILCGRCVDADPGRFRFDGSPEVATLTRRTLVVPPLEDDEANLARVRAALDQRIRRLRRSVHIRHVDAGSDGAEEWEVAALTNPVYDVQRLGIFFTASPRHADILLVTGAGALGMRRPLARTLEAMPDPKVVIAAGTDAVSGGLVGGGYATAAGLGDLVGVDVWVPGSPASPFSLLHAMLLALGILPERGVM
jgi:Ni,Fe-hydrogenase III small subunit/ferredoxin